MITVLQLGGQSRNIAAQQYLIVHNNKGRGYAIHDALPRISQPVTLILHKDTKLPQSWKQDIQQAINEGYVGGGFKLGFDKPTKYLVMLSKISDIFYAITGELWGDRAMFIDTEVLHKLAKKINIPLMEDVVLSKQMRKYGPTTIIKKQVKTSANKFASPLKHSFKIIKIRTLYSLGISPKKLYRMYYQ